MILFPPAKINLGLRIVRKRADGYHDLETGLLPVPWRDALEVIESDAFSFQTSGLPIPGHAESNLCVQAYHLLQQDFDLPPAAVHLHKIIPMGAGLGGGSSDAASMLMLLNGLFELSLATSALQAYAARLGSDCPFFIDPRPRLATGTGTTLEDLSLDLSGKQLVIVYPNVAVSTADAYARAVPRLPNSDLRDLLAQPLENWKDQVVNDFEVGVFQQHPALADIKGQLYGAGAVYASLSGSGSALYGLFNGPADLPAGWEMYTVWQGEL
jgi:4-diphosphocytidyl-2-C-methyl-D-erythritol kinase